MFEQIMQLIMHIAQTNYYLAFGAVFIGGLLTASNPCVLAMIPLAIGYIGGREEEITLGRSFILSLMLVLGLSVMFTIMGVVAISTGRMFGDAGAAWKYIVAIVCFVMGLHMLGLFHVNVPLPSSIAGWKPTQKGIVGAFLCGLLFGIVSMPCAVPILAVILTIITAKGSFVYGIGLLWIYALGHCLLILIAGTSMGAAKVLIQHKHLNRATEILRKISGILIILVGVYFLLS